MKPFQLSKLAAFSLLFSGAQIGSAQDKLDDFDAGKTVTGDKVDFSALKGRVVAIEYWGPR